MSFFKSGKIVFNEFHIDFSVDFFKQLECLLEDLLQVSYADNILLDVGGYPEYEENENLVVQVILDKNWDTPIYQSKSNNKKGFINGLLKAIIILRNKPGSGA